MRRSGAGTSAPRDVLMRNESERLLNTRGTGQPQSSEKSGPWLIALFLATCVIGWPWLSGRVTIPWDAKGQFLPQIQFLAQSIARGESPFWTPNIFAGHPQIADAQSLIFSPPFLLLALLDPAPGARAMDVTVYLVLAAGATAFFLWLRGRNVAALPAFAGALGFAFGASMAWRNQHTGQLLSLAYLPFVLLFLDKALARSSVFNGAVAGLFAGLLVLGRDQVGLLCVYFLIAYLCYVLLQSADRAKAVKSSLAPLTAGGLVGLAIITLPIVMTFLLAQESNRPTIDFEGAGRGSLHPALLFTMVAPDVFGSSGVQPDYWGPPSMYWQVPYLYIAQNMGQLYTGAVITLAVLWGLLSGLAFKGEKRFYTAALFMALVYALGRYTPVFAWMHAFVPGVDLYRRPADATFLIGFLASVLGALSLDALLKQRAHLTWPPMLAVALVLVFVFATMIALAVQAGRLGAALPHILLPAALFTVAAGLIYALGRASGRAYMSEGLAAAIAIFTVADLAYSNGPGNATALPPAHYDALEPNTQSALVKELKTRVEAGRSETRRDRVEIVGLGFHWPNATLSHNLEHTLGYNPVRLSWINRALGANDTTGLVEQKSFSPLYPSYRSPMANLLGLRWIVTGVPIDHVDKSLKPGEWPLVERIGEGYLYENADALPRVLFAADAAPADFEKMIETGQWPRTDFTQTVLLEAKDMAASASGSRPAGSAKIASYTNTRVEVEAESPQGGYVVLNDAWHPWWFATVDGQETPVLRANVIFRAVAVPAGRHSVVFDFRPVAGLIQQLRRDDVILGRKH